MTSQRTAPSTAFGATCIMAGLATFVASLLVDGGFWKGFFQGATIGLMVFGVYAISKARRLTRSAGTDRGGWRPSRDGG